MKSHNYFDLSAGAGETAHLNAKYGVVIRVTGVVPNQMYCGKSCFAIIYTTARELHKQSCCIYGETLKRAEFELANHAQKMCEYVEVS